MNLIKVLIILLFSVFIHIKLFVKNEYRCKLNCYIIQKIKQKNVSITNTKDFNLLLFESHKKSSLCDNYLFVKYKSKNIKNFYRFNSFNYPKNTFKRYLDTRCKYLGGGEDARSFWNNNKLFILVVDTIKENNKYFAVQCLGQIDTKNGNILNYNILKIKGKKINNCEKNWTPWVHNNNIYMSYMINPHTILSVNENNGLCRQLIKHNFNKNFPKISGGSPAIRYGNYYIGIGHKIQDYGIVSKYALYRTYSSYFYLFENKYPFNLVFISKPFTIFNVGCEFITGLEIKEDNFYITIGVHDKYTYLVKVDKRELEKIGMKDFILK
jgi:hypothetical protein